MYSVPWGRQVGSGAWSWQSDRHRWRSASVLLIGVVATFAWWWSAAAAGRIGSVGVLDHPPGSEVVLSLLTVLEVAGPDRYVVGNAALRVPVAGPTASRVVGEEVTVGGVVEAGLVRERWVKQAPGRPAKRLLGLLGLAAGAVSWWAGARPTRGGWVLRG